jgi:hypothetical protein
MKNAKLLPRQPRRGMKCPGYGATTPTTVYLSPIHRAEAP